MACEKIQKASRLFYVRHVSAFSPDFSAGTGREAVTKVSISAAEMSTLNICTASHFPS
jgi:hypothetical protein